MLDTALGISGDLLFDRSGLSTAAKISLLSLFIGCAVGAWFSRRGNIRRARLIMIVFGLPFVFCWLPFILVFVGAVVGFSAIEFFQFLLQPGQFWFALVVVFVCWASCKVKEGRVFAVVADALSPWLIAMGAIGGMLLVAKLWLSQAQWIWLFRIEEWALSLHNALDAILPKALWAKLLIIAFIFLLNVTLPYLSTLTKRLERLLSLLKAASASLAVFVALTLFGGAQAGEFGQAIAAEKHARLEQDAIAMAELAIGARIAQDPKGEEKAIEQFVIAIARGVAVDLKMPASDAESVASAKRPIDFSEEGLKKAHETRLRSLIRRRARELVDALARRPTVQQTTQTIATGVERLLGRTWTESDRAEAKRTFDEALKIVVSDMVKLTSHPLSQVLGEANAPELLRDVVVDLYKAEAKALSRAVAEPMSDALFRPTLPAGTTAADRFVRIASRPVFDSALLPSDLAYPSVERRLELKRASEAAAKARVR